MRAVRTIGLSLVVIAVAATAVPRRARADDRAAAKVEFEAGIEADRRKDYQNAIDHYQRAYDLAPHQNALYNIAVDYERIGELRDAATFYGRYLDEAGDDSEDRAKVQRLIDNLRKRPSPVSIRSAPAGAAITVDGAPVGTAPVTRELGGGTHAITARLDGKQAQREVSVEYGEPTEVVLALADQQGSLTVTSNVDRAAVDIDGASAGVTPLTIDVAAGDRKVIVHSDGYSSLERLVRVPAEGSAQITATLVRPLGYVEPPDPTRGNGYVLAMAAGPLIQADTNLISVGIGYRVRGWEASWMFSFFGEGRYGYGLQVRRYLGDGRIKFYLGGFGELGAVSSNSSSDTQKISILDAHAGFALSVLSSERFDLELTVDGGAALISHGEKDLAFPITAALQYRGHAAR